MVSSLGRKNVLKSGSFLSIETADVDEDLKTCLLNATNFFEMRTGRKLVKATYTQERYDGTNSTELFLRNYPGISIALVEIWDGDSWETIDATHYELRDERTLVYPTLEKRKDAEYSYWPKTYDKGIRITYDAGYDTSDWEFMNQWAEFGVPIDLENGVCKLAMKLWLDGKGGDGRFGLTSITRGPESFAVDKFAQGLPDEVQMTIAQYTEVFL